MSMAGITRLTLHVLFALVGLGCANSAASGPFGCARLGAIQELPFRAGEGAKDETYLYVMSIEKLARETALLRCTDDTTLMDDPRQSPVYSGFAIGDVAVMLLSDSTGVPIEDVLPDEVKAEWTEQGIYSYFKYVASSANRGKLKESWSKRLSAPTR